MTICDGSNLLFQDNELRTEIETEFKLKSKLIRLINPNKIDYCGSTAACIALESAERDDQKKDLFDDIKINKSQLEKMIKAHHYGRKSLAINDWTSIAEKTRYIYCPKCSKSFGCNKQANLNKHIRLCK